MSNHDDWFDDFMTMKMMDGDESSSSGGSDKGCLISVLSVLAVFLVFLELIG